MSTPKRPRTEQRFAVLERGQRETNQRLGRIEDTLRTSSHLFELMHERLEHVEGSQRSLVEGQRELVEGQRSLVERVDKLVEVTIRDRTERLENYNRVAAVLERLTDQTDALGQRLDRVADGSTRDRTTTSDRIRACERRLDAVEQRLAERETPP